MNVLGFEVGDRVIQTTTGRKGTVREIRHVNLYGDQWARVTVSWDAEYVAGHLQPRDDDPCPICAGDHDRITREDCPDLPMFRVEVSRVNATVLRKLEEGNSR